MTRDQLVEQAVVIGLDRYWRDNLLARRYPSQFHWLLVLHDCLELSPMLCWELQRDIREAWKAVLVCANAHNKAANPLQVIGTKPKYSYSKGEPLDRLGEECTEVIQELFKIKRFGMAGGAEWIAQGHATPRDRLRNEIGDVLQVVDELVEKRVFTRKELLEAKRRKADKLKRQFTDG